MNDTATTRPDETALALPVGLETDGPWQFVVGDDFTGPDLDRSIWSPYHIPHWNSRDTSLARYHIADGHLRLYLDDDQPPWCPEFDGDVRVSGLQTGHFAGPLGSHRGQERFNEHVRVRQEVATERLVLLDHGFVELRCRATLTPDALVSLYLIGFEEDDADDSGEITVMEIFGHAADDDGTAVGHGVKAINDPRLQDAFTAPRLPIRVDEWHTYAVDWRTDGATFLLDGDVIGSVDEVPTYPMHLMLALFEVPGGAAKAGYDGPPRRGIVPTFDVAHVRVWQRRSPG